MVCGIPWMISALWIKKNTWKLKPLLLSLPKKHMLGLSDDFMNPCNESHLFTLFCTSNLPFPPQVWLIPLLTKGFSLSKPNFRARWGAWLQPPSALLWQCWTSPTATTRQETNTCCRGKAQLPWQTGMVWGLLFPSEHFTVLNQERN